ncbi:hypothetical protein ACFCXT_15530 [Streptomyces vinaceus]|uniref:hypothetical protein n=1 Tax=Streptomyces vinaceus TaxID=1960 RepID=UPI0035DF1D4F
MSCHGRCHTGAGILIEGGDCRTFPTVGHLAAHAADKKIAQGKHHTQALLCPARRRADLLSAMLRDRTFYNPLPAPAG